MCPDYVNLYPGEVLTVLFSSVVYREIAQVNEPQVAYLNSTFFAKEENERRAALGVLHRSMVRPQQQLNMEKWLNTLNDVQLSWIKKELSSTPSSALLSHIEAAYARRKLFSQKNPDHWIRPVKRPPPGYPKKHATIASEF